MPTFKYVLTPTEGDWTEFFYHMPELQVRGGVTATDDPLAIEALLGRGFEEITEEPAEAAPARTGRKGR